VEIGTELESAGTGYLQAHSPDPVSGDVDIHPLQIVGIALEAKNLDGDSSAVESEGDLATNQRIKIMIV
jgi:hypothetical protein